MKPSSPRVIRYGRYGVPAIVFATVTLAALPAHAQRRDRDRENRGHQAQQENRDRAVERGRSNDRGRVEVPRQGPVQQDHRSLDAPRFAVPRVERAERFRSDGNRSNGFRPDTNREFRPDTNRSNGFRSDGNRSNGFRSDGNRSNEFRSDGNRSFGNRSDNFRSDRNRSFGNRLDNFRSDRNRSFGYRSDGNRSFGYRSDGYRSYGNRSYGYGSYGNRSYGYGSGGYRYGNRSYGYRSYGFRPYGYVFRPRHRVSFGLFLGYPVPYSVYDYGYSGPVYGYQPGYSGSSAYAYGGVSFEISPSDAAVNVDGSYAGVVGDFYDSPLTLVVGRHRIELEAPGYAPLVFDVDVVSGQVLPYRGDLQRY